MFTKSFISIHALREEGDAFANDMNDIEMISIHALREEGDRLGTAALRSPSPFLSTPSARRATRKQRHFRRGKGISIHALREEGDRRGYPTIHKKAQFLSTPSARRATLVKPLLCIFPNHFYPRPPRGGRRTVEWAKNLGILISIHALREEGDRKQRHFRRGKGISIHALREEGDLAELQSIMLRAISIHALREEGDVSPRGVSSGCGKFLSTPSARRATTTSKPRAAAIFLFLSTPSARRATAKSSSTRESEPKFLSTPSARRATLLKKGVQHGVHISIHALREEGDAGMETTAHHTRNFYPRPPRGGRRAAACRFLPRSLFLSTPSARRATLGVAPSKQREILFLSTPSARRATRCEVVTPILQYISIHALREEGDPAVRYHLSRR